MGAAKVSPARTIKPADTLRLKNLQKRIFCFFFSPLRSSRIDSGIGEAIIRPSRSLNSLVVSVALALDRFRASGDFCRCRQCLPTPDLRAGRFVGDACGIGESTRRWANSNGQ